MKHYTLVQSINIWMSVRVSSFGNERPKSPVSAMPKVGRSLIKITNLIIDNNAGRSISFIFHGNSLILT